MLLWQHDLAAREKAPEPICWIGKLGHGCYGSEMGDQMVKAIVGFAEMGDQMVKAIVGFDKVPARVPLLGAD